MRRGARPAHGVPAGLHRHDRHHGAGEPLPVVGARVVPSRFAIPSGPAADVLRRIDDDALGLARARVARELGDPDPFHVRTALLAGGEVEGSPGVPLTSDAATAALVAAGHTPLLAGIFAFRPPGPAVRAVPVDDPRRAYLRWRREPAPPLSLGAIERWSTADLGDEATATIRALLPVPGGLAIGSDLGLTLWTGGRFHPFPWPAGVRREARRVEAMAVLGGTLHVATSQALVTWGFRGEPSSKRHGPDAEDGHDDVNAMLGGDRLLLGYRTRFVGGDGPADTISLAADPNGVVYAGTRAGELHVVDGGGPIRRFGDHKPRPVRHLSWAGGSLWVAAAGALHRFDGAAWTSEPGEPTALATDERGRLWLVRDGTVRVREDGGERVVETGIERPWCLGFTPGGAWVGGVGRLARIAAR